MPLVSRCLAVIAFILTATTAHAATLADRFTSFWVLGDSLSDNGNLFAATGGAQPANPPYWNGRFSNGPVWNEPIMQGFSAAGHFTYNTAFGGAKALTDADGVPDLAMQVGAITAPDPSFGGASAIQALGGANPLVSLWFGANDLLDTIGTPGMLQTAMDAANAVADGVVALAAQGVTDFLVFNLPDLGKVPAYALLQPQLAADASLATATFNDTLAQRMAGLTAGGLNIYDVDMLALINSGLADPASFGLSDVIFPCIFPSAAAASAVGQSQFCTPGESLSRLFFDPVHPNVVGHTQIGATAIAALQPQAIPLPASVAGLLMGTFGLVLVGRRRRA